MQEYGMVMPMREQHAENGFSLIEVMIAMAIFAMGIGALYAMQFTSVKGNLNANQQTSSVVAATEAVEVLMTQPYESAVFNEGVTHTDTELTNTSALQMRAGAPFIDSIQWTVVNLGDNDEKLKGAKKVSVTVTYRQNRRQVNLDFLRIDLID
jgi:prepilin-type N-terminal cleavage/methylation domain-containing protein